VSAKIDPVALAMRWKDYDAPFIDVRGEHCRALAKVVIAASEYVKADDDAVRILLDGGVAGDAEVEAAFDRKHAAQDALAAAVKGE